MRNRRRGKIRSRRTDFLEVFFLAQLSFQDKAQSQECKAHKQEQEQELEQDEEQEQEQGED